MKTLLFVSLLTLRYSIGNAFIISSPHQSNALGISGINNYSSSKVKLFAGKVTEEVQNFKKAQFVASIAEKTGLSKTDSEAALAAVFETITEVRFTMYFIPLIKVVFCCAQVSKFSIFFLIHFDFFFTASCSR